MGFLTGIYLGIPNNSNSAFLHIESRLAYFSSPCFICYNYEISGLPLLPTTGRESLLAYETSIYQIRPERAIGIPRGLRASRFADGMNFETGY